MGNLNEMQNTCWGSVIQAFLKTKQEAEEEKYLKELLKEIAAKFEREGLFEDEEVKSLLDSKNKKSDEQTPVEFQREKFEAAKALSKQPGGLNWNEINSSYRSRYGDLDEKYNPNNWIADAAPYASSVSFATHVVKLTHSKIDTPSIFDQVSLTRPDVFTTSMLAEKSVDGAVAGNQYAPIYQFLELELNGLKLAAELAQEGSTALEPFASDEDQLKQWNKAFKQASVTDEMATHSLLKQVYFPVSSGEESYHLLSPVVSSSLAQAIFERLFKDQNKQTNKLYANGKYGHKSKVTYPRRAHLAVTASNHSNASQLNGKRGGRLHLLSAQPPVWKSQLTPPVKMKSWFDYGISYYAVKSEIDYLRAFLLRFETLELSTRDPEKRKWLINWGGRLVDEVLFQAGLIQALPAGWSNNLKIELKAEHQYFLDPFREDEIFQVKRAEADWQTVVCRDFSQWLNRQLEGKDKKFTPQAEHTKLWIALMEPELRELDDTLKTGFIERQANS